jgi:hypothetical protein
MRFVTAAGAGSPSCARARVVERLLCAAERDLLRDLLGNHVLPQPDPLAGAHLGADPKLARLLARGRGAARIGATGPSLIAPLARFRPSRPPPLAVAVSAAPSWPTCTGPAGGGGAATRGGEYQQAEAERQAAEARRLEEEADRRRKLPRVVAGPLRQSAPRRQTKPRVRANSPPRRATAAPLGAVRTMLRTGAGRAKSGLEAGARAEQIFAMDNPLLAPGRLLLETLEELRDAACSVQRLTRIEELLDERLGALESRLAGLAEITTELRGELSGQRQELRSLRPELVSQRETTQKRVVPELVRLREAMEARTVVARRSGDPEENGARCHERRSQLAHASVLAWALRPGIGVDARAARRAGASRAGERPNQQRLVRRQQRAL